MPRVGESRRHVEESLDDVASVVEKLAVLLAAGVAPAAAWIYLSQSQSERAATVSAIANSIDLGSGIADAILHNLQGSSPGRTGAGRRRTKRRASARMSFVHTVAPNETAWRGLAAAWIVATEAGAPLAPALREFSSSLRTLAEARRAAATALSGPQATAKLVVVLPVVGILFGVALGFDTIGTLISTPPGLVCLFTGLILLWAGRAWNRRMVRAASPTDLTPGLGLDLLAVAVSGGASIAKAKATVASAFDRSECAGGSGETPEADAVFDLSHRAGVPAATLLRSEAERTRREAGSAAERKAATLAVTLMMPLGLCVLPAFMLLGVAPLMISVLSSTVGGL